MIVAPRASGRLREQRAHQTAEQFGLRASGREGDADPAGGLDDAGGDFEKPEPYRLELRGRQIARLRDGVADREDEPIAAVWKTRRTWLASAERQLVRSEASWVLCSLIRFSACPRAQ